jgi:hypothetical protein
MMRASTFLAAIVLLVCAGWAATTNNIAVGTWKCSASDSGTGATAVWRMVVMQASDGTLSGTVSGDPCDFTMINPVLFSHSYITEQSEERTANALVRPRRNGNS